MLTDVRDSVDLTLDRSAPSGACLFAPTVDDCENLPAAAPTVLAESIAAWWDVPLYAAVDPESVSAVSERSANRRVDVQSVPEYDQRLDLLVDRVDAAVVVTDRERRSGLLDDLRSTTAAKLARNGDADVLTIDHDGQFDTVASILVPITDGPNSPLAVEAAIALAEVSGAAVDLFHVQTPDSDVDGQRLLANARAAIGESAAIEIDTWLFEAPTAADAIVEQSGYYDVTVIGAPQSGPLMRFVFGSTTTDVTDHAVSPVIVAHARADR